MYTPAENARNQPPAAAFIDGSSTVASQGYATVLLVMRTVGVESAAKPVPVAFSCCAQM